MICSKHQRLRIRYATAKGAVKKTQIRRQMREHVRRCAFCQKGMQNKKPVT